MKYLLYHGPSWSPGPVAEALSAEQVELKVAGAAAEIHLDHRPTVYLVDPPTRPSVTPQALVALRDSGIAILALGKPGEQDVPAELPAELLVGFVRSPCPSRELLVSLRTAFRISATARSRLGMKLSTRPATTESYLSDSSGTAWAEATSKYARLSWIHFRA